MSGNDYWPLRRMNIWHRAAGVRSEWVRNDEDRLKLYELRAKLILEEAQEAAEELSKGKINREALAKELADILVVTYGTAELMGINLEGAFDEVMDSNDSKLDGMELREDGKIMKGPHYKPPTMAWYV